MTNETRKAGKILATLLNKKYNYEIELTLGNLYRQEGKLDEAIIIHQKILRNNCVSNTIKKRVSLELGCDYLEAGFLDKAELIFLDLSNYEVYKNTVHDYLIAIYERQANWSKAISYTENVLSKSRSISKKKLVNYYCELIENYMSQSDKNNAYRYIEGARSIDENYPRLRLLEIDFMVLNEDFEDAISTIKAFSKDNKNYIRMCQDLLFNCCKKIERYEDFIDYVNIFNSNNNFSDMKDYFSKASTIMSGEDFYDFLKKSIPNLGVTSDIRVLFCKVLGVKENSTTVNRKESITCFMNALDILSSDSGKYFCTKCGFSYDAHFWKCLSCNEWGSLSLQEKN
ncbi:MAG: hypothetical protein VX335_04550 [Pseudomonadota bacterium]|nr:hypothetical protein [Pseudomonadota bacterium]